MTAAAKASEEENRLAAQPVNGPEFLIGRCWDPHGSHLFCIRKAPRGGRLGTGCGRGLLTPGETDQVSVVHAWPALCLTGEERGSRLWEEMLGA